MTTTDVAVVGGGPAGVAAAITLARGGRNVVLVDKATFPRDKCCGDGLTTGALRRYEMLGLSPACVPSWMPVEDVWVRSPSGRTVVFPLPRDAGTYAAVARRADLDGAFLDVARRHGVGVREGTALRGLRTDGDRVVLELGDGVELAASYTVGADGMWSTVRKLAAGDLGDPGDPGDPGEGDGAGRYLGEWHAFRQYFTGVSDAARELWVWFEPDLLPGYAWSFPLPGNRANIGFGIRRDDATATHTMKAQWLDLLARRHIRDVIGEGAVAEAPHKAWPIPAQVDTALLHGAGGRALLVGDAARATDPMTGEGIGQALETGVLAAEAILATGPDRPAAGAARYERAVRCSLGVDHQLASLLSRALRHRRGARAAVRIAGSSDWTRRNFARWLFEDYPRAVLATPSRWHRGMLSGPGAYRSSG